MPTTGPVKKPLNSLPSPTTSPGQAAGGALWASKQFSSEYPAKSGPATKPVVSANLSAFQGPVFTDAEISKLLKVFPVEFEYKPGNEIAKAAAEQILALMAYII